MEYHIQTFSFHLQSTRQPILSRISWLYSSSDNIYKLKNEVLWFDISVNKAEIMHHFKAISRLSNYPRSLSLRKAMVSF